MALDSRWLAMFWWLMELFGSVWELPKFVGGNWGNIEVCSKQPDEEHDCFQQVERWRNCSELLGNAEESWDESENWW